MAKNFYGQMPSPTPKNPHLPKKLECKSPAVGANFWCKSPRCVGGDGWLWQKLIAGLLLGRCGFGPGASAHSESFHLKFVLSGSICGFFAYSG